MRTLLKVILIIGFCFAMTFILVKVTGVLTIEKIKSWLEQAKNLSPIYVGSVIVALLFADLFIAVPTLTVTMFAGFFLGFTYGIIAALSGVMLAGICGYVISYYFGERILNLIIKDQKERDEVQVTFQQHGFIMIVLSRAVPILPEVTACLAGMTRMSFSKFLFAWSLSSIPYVMIAAYAGSISSLENPKPAIFTALLILGTLWIGWYIFRRRQRKKV